MLKKFIKRKDSFQLSPHKKEQNYTLWGFLIPFCSVALAILIRAIVLKFTEPSVNFSMLYSDAYHQYFPFFKDFRNALRSGDSLLYNWSIGMGIDYLGLISYYLGSPLNLLSVLVPEPLLVDYFTMLNPVRIGFAGMFFTMLLKKIFGRNDLPSALFGSFYATCAWVFGYMWNSMWMDTFALLPLVVMGTWELLENRKFVVYTISLFLSVFINYYVGFFTCIFTLLVFICYEICRFRSFRKFLVDLGLMAVFTILAIGMTAVLSLPTLAALQTTSSSVNEFPKGFQLNFPEKDVISDLRNSVTQWLTTSFPNLDPAGESFKGWSDFLTNALSLFTGMKQVATHTFASIKPNYSASEALPNIYCGVFANIFLFLFLTSRQLHKRDRICGFVLLLFINLSFVLKTLDYIWHGFHFTNMIPYRFSFLYSFVMLFVAYRVWLIRNRLRLWQVLVSIGLSVVFLLNSEMYKTAAEAFAGQAFQNALSALQQSMSVANIKALLKALTLESIYPLVNWIFLAMYSIAAIFLTVRLPLKKKAPRKQRLAWYQSLRSRKKTASSAFICVLCVEFLFNIIFFGTTFHCSDLSQYPRGLKDTERIIDIMEELEEDNLFYRTESTHTQTYNDGALNGYNGITTFTSSANASVTKYMQGLGYGAMATWNRYAFEEGSPVTNLFLNLKYMLERQNKVENNPYFTDVHSSGKVHLLQNNYYLPLGFMVDPAVAELDFTDGVQKYDNFTFQNNLLSAALGTQSTPWKLVAGDNLYISSTDSVSLSNVVNTDVGSCSYKATGSGSVFYTYTFEESGLFCVRYNMPKRNNITVSYDDGSGYKTLYTETYAIPFMMSVCQVNPGDRVQITLKCKDNESGSLKLWGGILDQREMDVAHHHLSQSTLELTEFENTFVEGTITCDQAGLLYTSIPQNGENWKAYVDGEEAEITLIGDAMIGLMLPEGTHTVTFRYHNKAFTVGIFVSLLCAAIFGIICWFVYSFLKKNPGKFTSIQKLLTPYAVTYEPYEEHFEQIRLRGVHPKKKKSK